MTRASRTAESIGRTTRTKLMVLLPLTMAALVGATGFFTFSMADRFFGARLAEQQAWQAFAGQLGIQIALISLVSAAIGLSIAIGITQPVRQMARQLESMASGDLRAGLEIRSVSELDSLAGAFNAAVDAVNRYLLHGLTGAVLTMNTDGVVIGASPAAEGILGYREEDLIGRRLGEILTPARGNRAALAALETALGRRQPVALDDVEVVARDGRPMRIGLAASYLRRGSGDDAAADVVGVLITMKDLAEIRKLRDRLRQADHLVTLGTVTAGVAHELRNPLGSLRGLTELLGRDFAAEDPRRRYVQTMLDAIDRLNRLIEDLLLFSSPAPAVIQEIDLGALASEIAGLAGHGVERRVRLDIDCALGRMWVLGHRDHLAQALTNVIANAVDATPDDGVVTVRAEATDRDVIVRVHNTGSFIPPDKRSELFVPFFTTKPSGTGLGLAIARQFVTTAGGRIDVDSDPEHGTTFSIELPRTEAATAARTIAAPPAFAPEAANA